MFLFMFLFIYLYINSFIHSFTYLSIYFFRYRSTAGISSNSSDSAYDGLSDRRAFVSPPSPTNITIPPAPTSVPPSAPVPGTVPGSTPVPNTGFEPHFYHPTSRSMRSFSSGSSRDRGDSTPASVSTPHTFGEGTCFPGCKSDLHSSVTQDIPLTSPLCGSLRDLPFDRIVDLAYMFNYNDDERYTTHDTHHQHTTYNTQHSIHNIQYTTYNIQYCIILCQLLVQFSLLSYFLFWYGFLYSYNTKGVVCAI